MFLLLKLFLTDSKNSLDAFLIDTSSIGFLLDSIINFKALDLSISGISSTITSSFFPELIYLFKDWINFGLSATSLFNFPENIFTYCSAYSKILLMTIVAC